MPFVNLGLCAEAASSLLAPQLMGYHRAAEALLLGEPLLAEAALEVGLVNRVVPPSEANALARRQALKLASKPLPALMETKRLMKKGQLAQVLAQIAEEGTLKKLFRRFWKNGSLISPPCKGAACLTQVRVVATLHTPLA